jgi:hypothetical protein
MEANCLVYGNNTLTCFEEYFFALPRKQNWNIFVKLEMKQKIMFKSKFSSLDG